MVVLAIPVAPKKWAGRGPIRRMQVDPAVQILFRPAQITPRRRHCLTCHDTYNLASLGVNHFV